MPFWTYMLHCADRTFYVGHTDNLENRVAQHEQGEFCGYTADRRPVKLVWCSEFPSRYEALSAERRIKGWSKAKKLALIRDDWKEISRLARNREKKERASTSSARTDLHRLERPPTFVRPEPAAGDCFSPGESRTRLLLARHPDSSCEAVERLEVELSYPSADTLVLSYSVCGRIDDLLVPAPAPLARTDGLWQHTCFEAFVRDGSGGPYSEFNLSPSGEWAAYRFDGYRTGMSELAVEAPRIETLVEAGRLELRAELPLPQTASHLALSAVIEEVGGRKSYWALAHPAAKPDFHHPDSFVHELS